MVYDAGTAALSVIPDFKGVDAFIRKEAQKWGVSAGQAFGKSFSDTAGRQTRDTPAGPTRERSRRQGVESGGGFADGFRKRVQAALKNLPPVEIGAATTEAEQKLRDLRLQLERLADKRVGIDIDTTAALAEAQRVEQQLDELARSSPNVQVRADTLAASAQLAAITAQVEALSRTDANVDVDVDTGGAVAGLSQVGSQASLSSSRLGTLIAVGATLAPVIVPAAAAAAGAVAAIGTAALAGAAGLGVAALGFMGIGDAVKAMGAAQADAGKSAVQLAQRQSQVASAADQVRSAERALANTRSSNADAARRAANQVADAERSVARAQQEARQATLDLVRAREEERRANQDLVFDLEGVEIAQRRAFLDAADAKRDLDRVLSNPRATDEQREAAQIAYDEISLRVRELAVQQQRLAAEQTHAAKVGVSGSDRVRAAQERVRDTTDGVTQAQRSLADAIAGRQSQQRQAAFALANAQQSVIAAQRSLEQASIAAGTAGVASADKLREAMNNLSPSGRKFAAFLFGLRDEWKSLRAAAAEGLLPGVQSGIERLLPYLPQVKDFIGRIATVLGDVADRSAAAFAGPQWRSFFDFVDRTAAPTLAGFLAGMGNLALGFANLLAAFEPVSTDFNGGLLAMTERFADWSATLGENRGFQDFIDYIKVNGPKVVGFLGDAAVVVGKLAVAFAPLGALMVDNLVVVFDWLAKQDPGVLLGIAAGIGAVAAGLALWLGGPVAAVVIGITAVVAAVVYAYNRFDWFRTAINTIGNVIRAYWTGVWTVLSTAFRTGAGAIMWVWDNVLKPTFNSLVSLVRDVLAPTFIWLWRNVISPVWAGISLAIDVAWALIKVALGAMQIFIKIVLAPLFLWLYNAIIKPAWANIRATILSAWQNGIRPVFNAFGGFLRDHVAPAFKRGVDAIGAAWARIRDVAKVPVRFVVDTVINQAIIDNFNKLAKVFGVDTVKRVALPKGFAAGGILPGYTPGKDVHRFVSPTGGALDLSGGEAILRPEGTRALGADWVAGINRAARTGGVGGVQRWLGGFADGGILGTLGRAASRARRLAGDAISGVTGLLSDPAGVLRRLVNQVIGLIPGKNSLFGQLAAAAPKRLLDGATQAVTGFLRGGDDGNPTGGPGNPIGGSAGMMRILRSQFPGLSLISGFRPGSVTLGGNRSYHASDRAVDVAPRRDVAQWINRTWGRTRELITPYQEYNLLNGRKHTYTGAVWNQHNFAGGNAHVHWAYDQGGWLPPGVSTVVNGTGQPEAVFTHQQFQALTAAAGRTGDGVFEGVLVLEDGTFMGRIRGQMEQVVDGALGSLADARVYGTT